jgi:protein-disulfide isomerase
MAEQFAPTPSVFPAPKDPRKHRLSMLVFAVILGIFVLFGYRVFRYYRQIQTGTLDATSYNFQSTRTSESRILAAVKAAPGSGELATTDDPSLGPTDAKLTIVQFADFGCPYSQQESYIVTALAKQYPEDLRIIYRDFPLSDLHPGADLAAQAGQCAHDQGNFWTYHDILYRNSGDFTADALLDYAGQAGLNKTVFETCLTSGKYQGEVSQDLADGLEAGVVGTPTFFFNGQKIEGAIPFATFKSLVDTFVSQELTP